MVHSIKGGQLRNFGVSGQLLVRTYTLLSTSKFQKTQILIFLEKNKIVCLLFLCTVYVKKKFEQMKTENSF